MPLGVYENFPENIHETARFSTQLSNKKLQHTIMQILHELNTRAFSLEEISEPSVHGCTVAFEFGIAEANNFNYLDEKETQKATKIVNAEPFSLIDLLCALRYYTAQDGKKKPLKFDYYMIRFLFDKNQVEMQVFHERGPRYISPEGIINLIVKKVNQTFSKTVLRAF